MTNRSSRDSRRGERRKGKRKGRSKGRKIIRCRERREREHTFVYRCVGDVEVCVTLLKCNCQAVQSQFEKNEEREKIGQKRGFTRALTLKTFICILTPAFFLKNYKPNPMWSGCVLLVFLIVWMTATRHSVSLITLITYTFRQGEKFVWCWKMNLA